MALFFALFPGEEALQALAEFQSELSERADAPRLHWEPQRKFHLTLKYLGAGDSSDEMEARAIRGAEQVRIQFAPFEISFQSIGAFPDETNPEYLWVGVNEGFPVLTQLAESLDRSLNSEGFREKTSYFDLISHWQEPKVEPLA